MRQTRKVLGGGGTQQERRGQAFRSTHACTRPDIRSDEERVRLPRRGEGGDGFDCRTSVCYSCCCVARSWLDRWPAASGICRFVRPRAEAVGRSSVCGRLLPPVFLVPSVVSYGSIIHRVKVRILQVGMRRSNCWCSLLRCTVHVQSLEVPGAGSRVAHPTITAVRQRRCTACGLRRDLFGVFCVSYT